MSKEDQLLIFGLFYVYVCVKERKYHKKELVLIDTVQLLKLIPL